jgi:exopolysaccharide production protein ExoQ
MTTLTFDDTALRPRTLTTFSSIVGFYLAFRLVAVVISVRLFDADPQIGVLTSLALNYLIFASAAFLSFGPGLRNYSWFYRIGSFRWSLVFVIFSGCSLLWTSSASLSSATAFWCAMTCDFLTVITLLRIGSVDETIARLMSGYVWGACAIALVGWMLPSQSDLRLGDEDFLGPNQIGYACAFAVFLAQYLMRRGEKGFAIPALFLALTLLRSLSKTTLIAFVAGQTLLLFRDRSLSRKTKLYISFSGVLIVTAFWSLLTAYYDVYTHAGNQSETLTGRIGIWAYILNEALQQPWIGHGFHSVWKVIPPFGPFEARHAHNELLQQFYAYGVVGVAIVLALYWSVYRDIRKISIDSLKTLFFAMLLFVLVRGLADTEVFDLSLPLWFLALIGSTMISHNTRTEVHP